MRLRQRSLSRHFSSTENLLGELKEAPKGYGDQHRRPSASRFLPYDTPALLVHPVLPLLLFVLALGIWALLHHVYHDCAFVGPDSGWCLRQQHGPRFNLSRGHISDSWLPNWREDGRCGAGFPGQNGHPISICNPFSKDYCCSRWSWCGSGAEYCVHATHKPYNESRGLSFFVSDFVAKATGSGDLYQQGWHEASADKAAAFDKWDKFQRAARSRFGLQSGEHVQWHIGAAVAQRFGKFRQRFPQPPSDPAIAEEGGTALTRHHERLLLESTSPGTALGAAGEQLEKPSALPGLLSAISQAGGSSRGLEGALARSDGSQQEGRRMGEEETSEEGPPDAPGQRKKSGVAALGWFPHSWESIPHEVVNASEPQPVKAVGEGSGAWTRGSRMGREDRWDELYVGREGDRALHRGEQPYGVFQRCNPWRWIHFHNTVVRNKTDRMLHEAEAGRGTEDPRPPAEEGLEGYLGRAKPGTFGGKVASRQGKSEILVIWHAFERPKTCVEDEDVQVPRHNLLYFIRTAVRENDGVDYIFNFGGRVDPDMLELIPPYSNVRVRFIDGGTLHSDTCTFQQTILEQGHAIFHQYKYFFLINNGMRGPFLSASMLTENVHWTQPFTSRLNNETKLVGVTISCEVKTHVQGPFLATDRVGIQYVLDLWGGCWGDHWDEIVHAEIGLTQAIMEDGYNVASMQHEYEGLDFRLEPTKLSCRGKLNPSFCCGMEDPLQLHWIKYGGAVMRIGAQSPYLIRAVENLTDATLALTPPLIPSTRWQLPSDDWFEQRDAAQRNVARRNTLWRLSSRLFQRVFSLSRSGNQLAGKQAAASARYLTLLSEDEGHKQFRYQLQPHMSGFESDDTNVLGDSAVSEEDLARLEHQTKQPRTTLSSKDPDRELSETTGFILETSSFSSRLLQEPLVTDPPFRSSMEAWGLGKRRNAAPSTSPASPSISPPDLPASAFVSPSPADLRDANEVLLQSPAADEASPVNATDEMAMATASGGAYTSENVTAPTVDAATRSFWQATFGNARSAFGAITASTAASAAASAERVAALHAIGRRGSDGMQVKPNLGMAYDADDDSEGDESSTTLSKARDASEDGIMFETENLMDSPSTRAERRDPGSNSTSGDSAFALDGSMRPTARGRGGARAHPSPQERWSWGQYMAAFSHLSSPSPDGLSEPGSLDDSEELEASDDLIDGLSSSLGLG